MAYTKKTWKNNETKLNAANLNAIENGLEAAATKADEAAAKAASNTTTINGHTTAINGLTTSLNGLTTTVNNNKTAADSKFTSVENRIAAVEQVDSTQNSTISTLGTEITRVEGKFDSSVANLTSSISTTNTNLNSHKNAKNNPHGVTATQVGAYSKTEIDTINSAAIHQCPTMLYSDSTRNYTYNIDDISRVPQKLLINTDKTYDAAMGYTTTGPNALWNLVYSDTFMDLGVDGWFGDFETTFSGYTYDLIKKDINSENIINYDSTDPYARIPENYLSTMQCVYPVYVHGSTGFSTNGSGDDATGCYTSLIFESPSQHKLYIVPCGTNNGLYERLMFHIVSDRYLLIQGNFVYKRVVDLKAYGDDLVFHSIGFNNISMSGAVRLLSINAKYPIFALYTDLGETMISPKPLLSVGTYEIDFNPSVAVNDYEYLIYYFENPNINISIKNSIQYARNSSNLISLGRNIPSSIDMDKLNRDMELKAQLAVKQLINVGTSDPDASTPGLLYFKYLP